MKWLFRLLSAKPPRAREHAGARHEADAVVQHLLANGDILKGDYDATESLRLYQEMCSCPAPEALALMYEAQVVRIGECRLFNLAETSDAEFAAQFASEFRDNDLFPLIWDNLGTYWAIDTRSGHKNPAVYSVSWIDGEWGPAWAAASSVSAFLTLLPLTSAGGAEFEHADGDENEAFHDVWEDRETYARLDPNIVNCGRAKPQF